MAQKPPAWTRPDQVPLMLSRDVDGASVQDLSQSASTLAEQLIRNQQTVINRFVAVQRQQIELGEKDVHHARLPLDGVDVHYTHVQGLERMHYHIRPEARAPVVVPEEPRKPVFGQPEFLMMQIPTGLAVEFFDGAT